jgi:hypothetical protein
MVGKRIAVCALQAYALQSRSVCASAQVARQELLRQIAVPMKGGGFAS